MANRNADDSSTISRTNGGTAAYHDDPRPAVRVFLASSSELSEERACFADTINHIATLPDVQRNLRVEPVLWETHADQATLAMIQSGSADPIEINKEIARSVKFERLDLVVVVVGSRIGAGTADELARSLELSRLHDRPQLLVFARDPNVSADSPSVAAVATLPRSVVDAGIIPTRYTTIEHFIEMLKTSVPPTILKPDPNPAPADTSALRRWFTASSAVSFLLSIGSLALVQIISYPSRVDRNSALAVLVAPVLLFLGLSCNIFLYDRLLRSLRRVWFSRSWCDASHYAAIRHVVPRFLLPPQLPASVLRRAGSTAIGLLWLALALGPSVYAQGWVLFREITTWEVAVGWAASPGHDGRAVSTYVDRGGLMSWLLGLQDPAARRALETDPNEITYVLANGAFGSTGRSLDNLGPQVWLPGQGRLYLALLAVSIALVLATGVRIARLPVTLTRTPRRR